MKSLKELNAQFIGAGGEGVTNADGSPVPERSGVGVVMDCPCGCERQMYVPFKNPIDGGPALEVNRPNWYRVGETIETLTLTPSVLRIVINGEGCGWHGFITDGHARTC